MLVDPSRIPAITIFEAPTFPDERGFLLQSWVKSQLAARGLPNDFTQAIQTCSRRGVMRGMHFQWDPPMGKLVRCIAGAILDVVVDVRLGSPTLGDHVAVELRGRNYKIIWVPPGFAHATFALEEDSIVLYECTAEHGPGREGGITRVELPVALEAERRGVPATERPVPLPPITLELLPRQRGQTMQAEQEFHHGVLRQSRRETVGHGCAAADCLISGGSCSGH